MADITKTYLAPREKDQVKQNSVLRQVLEYEANLMAGGTTAAGQMAGGTGATSSTFWRGDGTWAAPPAAMTVVNVVTYGALGDFNNNFSTGSDDTSAIQAAINAAAAISGPMRSGAITYLPAGTYRISAPLTIPGDMQFIGAGRVSTVIINSCTTTDVIQVTGSSTTIADMTLYGTGVSTVTGASVPTAGWAIDITSGGNNSKFKDLTIGRTFNGINVGSSASNGEIEFVYMFDIYGQYMINGAPGWTIQDNQLDMTFYGGIYGSTAQFEAHQNSTSYSNGDVSWSNGGYYFCNGSGTSASSGHPSPAMFNTSITDGTASWTYICATNLVKINLATGSATVKGNDLSGPSRYGIVVNSGNNTISGNYFSQIIGIGLQIKNGNTGNTVTYNQFSQTFASSTDVVGSAIGNHINAVAGNTIVSGNVFNESSGISISWANSTDFGINNNEFIPPYGTPNLESAVQLVSCSRFNVAFNNIPKATSTGSIVVVTPTGNDYNIIGNTCGGTSVSNASGFGNVVYNT